MAFCFCSGVMGSAIAAHLANAGIPSLLLDMVPPALTAEEAAGLSLGHKQVRKRFAASNKARLLKTNRHGAPFGLHWG